MNQVNLTLSTHDPSPKGTGNKRSLCLISMRCPPYGPHGCCGQRDFCYFLLRVTLDFLVLVLSLWGKVLVVGAYRSGHSTSSIATPVLNRGKDHLSQTAMGQRMVCRAKVIIARSIDSPRQNKYSNQNQGFHQKQKELKAGLKTNLQCTSKGSIQEAQLETCTMTEVPVLSQNAAPGHTDKAMLGS